jgi:GGDEF domain-containing protein
VAHLPTSVWGGRDEPERDPSGADGTRSLERSCHRIARLAARGLGVPMSAVTVRRPGGGHAAAPLVASFGFARPSSAPVDAFAALSSASSGLLLVSDATVDARVADDALVTAAPFVRFCAGVPLMTSDGVIVGSLCVFDDEPRADVSDDDVETLRDLAVLVVDEYEGAGRREELREARDAARRLETTDALTGLSNRRMLDGMLDGALALARRTGQALAVLMIGLDGLDGLDGLEDATRDPGGDPRRGADVMPPDSAPPEVDVDDDLLVEMAERLASGVREHDLVARVGATEFVVVLQAVDRAAVAEAAGRLHEALTGVILQRDDPAPTRSGGRLRVNVGVALHPADGEDLASLLRAADVAMHQAKANGGGVRRFAVW